MSKNSQESSPAPKFKSINSLVLSFLYADNATQMAESKEKLKSLLMRVKEESKKSGSEFYIQKMKIIASGHITMWQIGGEKNGNCDRFYFLGSRIIVDGDCSHEIKRRLIPGGKAVTNLVKVSRV